MRDEPPSVWVMDPVEALAEKILGWCVHGLVKHYADAAWQKLVYLQAHRAAYSQADLRRIVQHTLAPGIRHSQPR
jgi:hypothetical protein